MKTFKLFFFLLWMNIKIKAKEAKIKAFWRHAISPMWQIGMLIIIIIFLLYILLYFI